MHFNGGLRVRVWQINWNNRMLHDLVQVKNPLQIEQLFHKITLHDHNSFVQTTVLQFRALKKKWHDQNLSNGRFQRCGWAYVKVFMKLGPEPAIGRLGLGWSSGGCSSHGYTSHASLRAYGAQLGGDRLVFKRPTKDGEDRTSSLVSESLNRKFE